MAGYTRQDTSNNISNGNVINASDLDAEFNQVQATMNAVTGHSHGGSDGEGAPITTIGPTQDVVASDTLLRPKTTDVMGLGSSTYKWLAGFFSGTVTAALFSGSGASLTNLPATSLTGTISIDRIPSTVVKTTGDQTVGGLKSLSSKLKALAGIMVKAAGDRSIDFVDATEKVNGSVYNDATNNMMVMREYASDGTTPAAQIAVRRTGLVDVIGDFDASGIIYGNGSGLTSLNMGAAGSGTLAVTRGGTGATSVSGIRSGLGFGSATPEMLNTIGAGAVSLTDWDEINGCGSWWGAGAANSPLGITGNFLAVSSFFGNSAFVIAVRQGFDEVYLRRRNSGVWASWVKIFG